MMNFNKVLIVLALLIQPMIVRSATLTLTWNDNSDNEDAFEIERSEKTPPNFLVIGTVGPNIETYDDTTVVVGIEYTYRVRAANSYGFSGYSNTDIGLNDGVPNDPDGAEVKEPTPVLMIVTDPETGGVTITPIIQ